MFFSLHQATPDSESVLVLVPCSHGMAVTDDDRRTFITNNVSADLQYVLQDAEISLANQYEVTQHYRNLRVFSALGDTKAEVSEALKADFRLDQAASPPVRAEVARFIAAWEVAK